MYSRNQPLEKTNLSSKWYTLRYELSKKDPVFFSKLGFLTDPKESDFGYERLVANLPRNKIITLDGYFQTLFFALPQRERLRIEILGQDRPAQFETTRAIALHIRLGDNLVGNPRLLEHYVNYYSSAVAQAIEQHDGIPEFSVFSDQEDVASLVMKKIECNWSIVPTSPSRPIQALRQMAACQGLVAYSSTLAWWAGFLQREGNVFVKKPWFLTDGNKAFSAEDNRKRGATLIPPDWIQIEGFNL